MPFSCAVCFNRDIATGMVDTLESVDHETKGPDNTWWMQSEVLPAPEPECYVLSPSTCTEQQREYLRDGSAVVKDWILVGRENGTSSTPDAVYERVKADWQAPLEP